MQNSYHCKTPDCKGWWINEDGVNATECPICKIVNCLNCKVIHTGLNCKQYQENLVYNDPDSQNIRTKEHLDQLLRTGVAKRCPKCGVTNIHLFYLCISNLFLDFFLFRLLYKRTRDVTI